MSTPTTIRDRIRENALTYGRDYLSSAEAAEYLGFAEQTLRGWRAKHRGPRYQKVSGGVRYYITDLDVWLDDQFVDAATGGDGR
jgi:hypothetical protein